MKKILLACDLDNTLIHSYKHKKIDDICVEIYNDREQSFITPETKKLIRDVCSSNIIFLPVTTRSIEQYNRIQWEENFAPEYSLVTNGSVFLKNNQIELAKKLSEEEYSEIEKLYDIIKTDSDFIKFRIVDDIYLFAYCQENVDIKKSAEKYSTITSLDTQYSGRKIYFFPHSVNKGYGVKNIAEKFNVDFIISAGDSIIDYSMLEIADIAIVPDNDTAKKLRNPNVKICEGIPFSEFVLKTALTTDFLINPRL